MVAACMTPHVTSLVGAEGYSPRYTATAPAVNGHAVDVPEKGAAVLQSQHNARGYQERSAWGGCNDTAELPHTSCAPLLLSAQLLVRTGHA